jgi:hypothetical protein
VEKVIENGLEKRIWKNNRCGVFGRWVGKE